MRHSSHNHNNLSSPPIQSSSSHSSTDSPAVLSPTLASLSLGPLPGVPSGIGLLAPMSGSGSSYDNHPQFFSTPPAASPVARAAGANQFLGRSFSNMGSKMPDIEEDGYPSESGGSSISGGDRVTTVRFGRPSGDARSISSATLAETNGDGYTNLSLMYSIVGSPQG